MGEVIEFPQKKEKILTERDMFDAYWKENNFNKMEDEKEEYWTKWQKMSQEMYKKPTSDGNTDTDVVDFEDKKMKKWREDNEPDPAGAPAMQMRKAA